MKAFLAMVKARTMEFVRDRGSFAWAFIFPILMIIGFAFAFSGNDNTLFKVGVLGPGDPSLGFLKTPQTQFISYDASVGRDVLMNKLRQHKIDALIDTTGKTYWINDQGKNHQMIDLLMGAEGGNGAYSRQTVTGAPIRYVDQLVPGVIAMNMMMGCLFGVGYVLVRYRKNGVLKRMKATPVSALSFVTAQGVSRFLIVFVTSLFVYEGTNIFLHFRMDGSYFDLILLTALGILSMIALGLALASRFKSEELAGGIINLITFPMMIFSGVFFSLEGTPELLQTSAQVLPLTHYIQAARAIMLEGAGLVQIAPDLLFLGVFTAACLGIAAWLFKWE
jgi:ABC-type multidrug transport system permease subunit